SRWQCCVSFPTFTSLPCRIITTMYRFLSLLKIKKKTSKTISLHKKEKGKPLEWLVYYHIPKQSGYSPTIQGRVTASKDSSNFYLQMNELKREDTAAYYCTAKIHNIGKEL
uniref:Immunoglobulin V-set domain-containing protein n=1 Tax=Naja naja TaxID=35670 RepID=A0A8C6X5G2_NAJNA